MPGDEAWNPILSFDCRERRIPYPGATPHEASLQDARFIGAWPKPLPPDATTEDWPRFLGPRHDLHSKETKLLKSFPANGPKMVWKVKRGTGHAPAVVAVGRLVMIHALEGREVVECLQPETGKRHWKFEYPVELGSNYGTADAPRAGPVIDGDLVFSGGMVRPPTGGLLRVDPKSGTLDDAFPWRARMFASVNAASPVAVGDAAFITEGYTEGGALVEFAPDGKMKLRWKAERFDSHFTTPVAHEGYLYGVAGSAGTEMVCYEIFNDPPSNRKSPVRQLRSDACSREE